MRIVQFMASRGYGGAEKAFVELSNGLAERHEVTALLVRDCSYGDRFDERVSVVELCANPTSNNPFLHFEIYSILQRLQPDIIHTHAAKGAMLVHRVNRFLGLAHMATKHNDRKGKIFNTLPFVSAVSGIGRDSVFSKVNGEVRVIHNGLVAEEVTEREPGDVFTMLAVGRLDAIKGFDLLIQQVAKVPFPLLLKIVGEGPEKESLQRVIHESAQQDRVELVGFREDIPQLMHNCDLVVVSSHQEGGPKVLAEALLYAPLLLSTPVGAVPEFLPEALQTTHDTLADYIVRIKEDYSGYTEIFRKLREKQAERFSFAHMLEAYERYYREIRGEE